MTTLRGTNGAVRVVTNGVIALDLVPEDRRVEIQDAVDGTTVRVEQQLVGFQRAPRHGSHGPCTRKPYR